MCRLAWLLLCLPAWAWAAQPGNSSTGQQPYPDNPPKNAEPGRKIDKPIPETYEPLTGPRWSNTFSDALDDARTLRREEQGDTWPRPRQADTVRDEGKKAADKFNIHAPQPPAPPAHKPPTIEEQGDSLSIHDR